MSSSLRTEPTVVAVRRVLDLCSMSRQDFDPLAETAPPRYAYESDESDEFNPFPEQTRPSRTKVPKDVRVSIDLAQQTSSGACNALIIVTGDAGKTWARGAQLGQQIGRVVVENVQVGIVFRPTWTDATVLVSEAMTRLPAWAMHPYAQYVLHYWKPTNVAILDSYPTPTYITSRPVPHHASPIRYLLLGSSIASIIADTPVLAPFSPPNLLLSTSAAFVSILALENNAQALLLLLPSPHVSPPAPISLDHSDVKSLMSDSDDTLWELSVIRAAHQMLLRAVGSGTVNIWNDQADAKLFAEKKRGRIGDIGEGSMYI